MKKLIAVCFILLFTLCAITASAQSQFSGWGASFNTIKLNKKFSVHADVQWRSTDEVKQTQTLLLRSGINFHANKNFILTAGYAYISNRSRSGNLSAYIPEHRIWQQLIYNHKIKTVFTQHRFRLEQRFISTTGIVNNELEKTGTVTSHRARYFIRNILPFQNAASFTEGWFGALQNEVFVNVANTDRVNGKFFDQNRLYLAIGYRLSRSFDLEAGYMNQYISGRGDRFVNNHIAQLATYLRL
ncbi:DUF2490 domain-containing protein [Nostoc ellipsosporum NOK]|nr:DUF2490 domain-containing protein [Nostoc ellipsosporum NOK]